MSTTFLIKVVTPCEGQQLVTEQSSLFYAGSSGDFTFAQVTRASTQTRWTLVVYEYSDANSPCYPAKRYKQVVPDANDPRGAFQGEDSNGNPDPSEGEASVEDWP